MPSQKRVVLETLDKKTLVELCKSIDLTGSQALNKAEIIAENGKVLIAKRKPTARLANLWEFPGDSNK